MYKQLNKIFKTLTGRSLSALGFLQINHKKRAQQRKEHGQYTLHTPHPAAVLIRLKIQTNFFSKKVGF